MVCCIVNIVSKERVVTTEANNSGRGLGDHDETVQDSNTGSQPRSLADSRVVEKLVLRNEEFET